MSNVIQRGTLMMNGDSLVVVGRDYGHCVSIYYKDVQKATYISKVGLVLVGSSNADANLSDKQVLDILHSV